MNPNKYCCLLSHLLLFFTIIQLLSCSKIESQDNIVASFVVRFCIFPMTHINIEKKRDKLSFYNLFVFRGSLIFTPHSLYTIYIPLSSITFCFITSQKTMERTTNLWVWFSLMIFLGISINGGLSEEQHHVTKKTRSSAVVVGTVYCDTCFNGAFSKSPNHLIPGLVFVILLVLSC